jgi:sulfite exporter TauE/SafE
MIAFGAGTMPAMVLTGIGAAKLAQFARNRGARLGLGLLIVLIGTVTLSLPAMEWLSAGAHRGH